MTKTQRLRVPHQTDDVTFLESCDDEEHPVAVKEKDELWGSSAMQTVITAQLDLINVRHSRRFRVAPKVSGRPVIAQNVDK